MAAIVFAAPYRPPLLPVPDWHGMEVTWTGWDGSVWRLNDPGNGVFLQMAGVEGLAMPSYTQWTQSSPAVAGQWFRGVVANFRKVFWPLGIYTDAGSQDWIDLDRAFWATMHPQRYGTWKITQPSGESRTLQCRFVDDGSQAFDIDPFQTGWSAYGLTLAADQPFWAGGVVQAAFKASDAQDFFNGSGKAPNFNISSGSTFASASLSNHGDEDAWPVWTIIGPSTGAFVGIGADSINVPFALADGQAAVVDTNPVAQTCIVGDYAAGILINPVDRTPELGTAAFAPIPAGQSSALNISLAGTGQVQVAITPLFRRAW